MIRRLTRQKLNSKSISPTAMRILVLDFLLDRHTAISLSDIEKGLMPADRVTIYRTLKTFEAKGLVHTIDDGTGTPKYALCLDECSPNQHKDAHVHFYCIACRQTFCLPDSKIPGIQLPDKFSSIEINLMVKGFCNDCAQ